MITKNIRNDGFEFPTWTELEEAEAPMGLEDREEFFGNPAFAGERDEKAKILIVDDHPHKLTTLEAILTEEDRILVKANSGTDALRHLLRENFALILMDVHMPGMDGFETAAWIRQRPCSEHTPIIFMTANMASDANLSKGYSLGAVDYIASPVVPEILQAKAAVFVELYRSNQKVKRQSMALRSFNQNLTIANRKLESQKREIHRSRESFRNIVEKNEEGLAVANMEGVIHFANPAFAKLMGRPVENLIGQPFPCLREAGPPFEMDWVLDGRGKIPVEIFLTETWWDGKNAYLIRVSDVSLRRKSEEALHQSEEKLRQAQRLESIGKLAGGIAHDFNNLLTAINGYTEVSLDALEDTHPIHANLIEVRRAGERAAQLTQQLLAYSRKQILLPQALDLNTVVHEMANMLHRLIGENIELVTDLAPDIGLVKVDHGQLEQVIMNLVINARDAMPLGGCIRVSSFMESLEPGSENWPSADGGQALAPNAYAVLSVADNGIGMDERTKNRIFDPFFTTKEVGKGTGLGLSMVYGFLKQSGGGITVTTAPGQGAVFKIFLPLMSETPVLESVAADGRSELLRKRTETILLVEDDGAVRQFLRNVLEQNGYQILEAEDGTRALTVSENYAGPIHLLVADIMMPNMGGEDLKLQVRKQRPEIKTLFISGYPEKPMETPTGMVPDSCFLQKPFSCKELVHMILEVLNFTNSDLQQDEAR